MKKLDNALNFSHTLLKEAVVHGDTVIDATVGNGNDTIFLASLVGPTGHVLGFDIQQCALEKTQQQLLLTGQQRQVQLIHDSHENVAQYL